MQEDLKYLRDMGYHERTYRPLNRKSSEKPTRQSRPFHIWGKRLIRKPFDLNDQSKRSNTQNLFSAKNHKEFALDPLVVFLSRIRPANSTFQN